MKTSIDYLKWNISLSLWFPRIYCLMELFNILTLYSIHDENTCENTVILVLLLLLHLWAKYTSQTFLIKLKEFILTPVDFLQISDVNESKFGLGVWQVCQQLKILNMWKDTDHYQSWLTLFTFDMKDLSPGIAKDSKTDLAFTCQPLMLKQFFSFTIQAVTSHLQILWPNTSPPWYRTNSLSKFRIKCFSELTSWFNFLRDWGALYSSLCLSK